MITKTYDNSLLEVDAGKREVVSIINSDSVDRDQEIVQPQGMQKKDYAGNPIVLLGHDYRSLPIGSCKWIKASKQNGQDVLVAKTYISDKTKESRDVFNLMQDGILKGFSIGFQSLQASAPTADEIKNKSHYGNAKLVHRKWNQLEYSVVTIPCNPDALSLAVSKGVDSHLINLLSKSAPLPDKTKLNQVGYNWAKKLIHDKKINTGKWDWDTDAENELLGDPENWDEYSKWFLAIDENANPQTKKRYHFPIGKAGEVYLHALAGDESRAAANGHPEIQSAAHTLFKLAEAMQKIISQEQYLTHMYLALGKLNDDKIVADIINKIERR